MARRRTISRTSLLFASVSAILGSGWLFAAFYTSELAGPAAIIAWVLGGFANMVIAFVYAEQCAMIPIMGSSSRIPHYTHGTIVSFVYSWMIWLCYAALVPTEVQAVIQYINYYLPGLVYAVNAGGGLTKHGYLLATILMLIISTINIFSLRWLIRFNTALTTLKIIIPITISLLILSIYFSPNHVLHPVHSQFMPFGLHGVLTAISTGGVIFAFNGFKQACEMAGEAKHPSKTLPFAIIGSIIVCLLVYLLLQAAFLSSLDLNNLLGGWQQIYLKGGTSPFAAITTQDNLKWFLPILYIGAVVGPLAAALMYGSSSSRSLYATSKNGYLPEILGKKTLQGNPWVAIVINFCLGMFMFAPLPGWDKMITFLTSLMAITYGIAPICLITFRKQLPDQKRPFKLPFATIWSFFAFYFCNLFAYWSGWTIISKLGVALILGLIVLFSYHFSSKRGRKLEFNWYAANWLWPYLIGLILISYLGNFGGGIQVIPFGWDFLIIGIFSAIILYFAQMFTLSKQKIAQNIESLNLDFQ